MTAPAVTIAVEWIFCGIAIMSVVARLYVRYSVAKLRTQVEDWFVIFGAILFVIWVSCDTFAASQGFMDNDKSYLHGAFSDQIKGDDANRIAVLKVVYASSVPYYLNLWMVKFALLGFYYRLIPRGGYLRHFLWLTIIVCVVMIIVIVLINLFLCVPISLNWALDADPSDPGTCYASTSLKPFLISVISNLSTDIAIFVIPFPLLPQLRLATKQKVALCVTFSLGAITIIVCVARAVAIALSGNISRVAILTAFECSTAMVVASLPAMRVLLKRTVRKATNSQSRSRSNGSNSGTAASSSGDETKKRWFGRRTRNFASDYPQDLEMNERQYGGVPIPCEGDRTYYQDDGIAMTEKNVLYPSDMDPSYNQPNMSDFHEVEYAKQVAQRFEDPLQSSGCSHSGHSSDPTESYFQSPDLGQSRQKQQTPIIPPHDFELRSDSLKLI